MNMEAVHQNEDVESDHHHASHESLDEAVSEFHELRVRKDHPPVAGESANAHRLPASGRQMRVTGSAAIGLFPDSETRCHR